MPETISYRSLTEIPGVSVLSVRQSPRLWRVYHETFTICAVFPETPDQSEWMYRGRQYHSGGNDLMLMEPGEVHTMKRIRGEGWGSYDVLTVSPDIVHEISQSLDIRWPTHLAMANMTRPDLFGTLVRFLATLQRQGSQLEIESRFIPCLSRLLNSCAEQKPKPQPAPALKSLMKARDFLRENFDRNVTLGELASISGLSRYHFLRSFCRLFGLPPHAYQIQVRVAKAQAALSRGGFQSEMDFGFADQSHFIRHFRNIIGVTPGQYAGMIKKPFVAV